MGIESLVDLTTAAAYARISEEVLREWTASGHAPHYEIDGSGCLYKRGEIRKWVEENLLRRSDGMPVPKRLQVLKAVDRLSTSSPPTTISAIGSLLHIPVTAICPGIYFLCQDDEVVYVGQAVSVLARIACHIGENLKEFDHERIYFLPCPREHLSEVERQWIQELKPKYNRAGLPRKHPSEYTAIRLLKVNP